MRFVKFPSSLRWTYLNWGNWDFHCDVTPGSFISDVTSKFTWRDNWPKLFISIGFVIPWTSNETRHYFNFHRKKKVKKMDFWALIASNQTQMKYSFLNENCKYFIKMTVRNHNCLPFIVRVRQIHLNYMRKTSVWVTKFYATLVQFLR